MTVAILPIAHLGATVLVIGTSFGGPLGVLEYALGLPLGALFVGPPGA